MSCKSFQRSSTLQVAALFAGHLLLDLWRSGETSLETARQYFAKCAEHGVTLEDLGATAQETSHIRLAN